MDPVEPAVEKFMADLPFFFCLASGQAMTITHWSSFGARELGYNLGEQGLTLTKIIDQTYAEGLTRWLKDSEGSDTPYCYQGRLVHKNGSYADATVHFSRMIFAGKSHLVCTGIFTATQPNPKIERIAAVAERSQRNALAMIADGMGHEINNPLQAILGFVELAMLLNKDPVLTPHLKEITEGAERVKAAVASLRILTIAEGESEK